MLMFGCDPPSQISYHQQGNTSHFRLILIIKRHIVHQLAPAMVQGVLTEEVSCYIQNNDSSPLVSEMFVTFRKFPELFLFRHVFADYYRFSFFFPVTVVLWNRLPTDLVGDLDSDKREVSKISYPGP